MEYNATGADNGLAGNSTMHKAMLKLTPRWGSGQAKPGHAYARAYVQPIFCLRLQEQQRTSHTRPTYHP
eukprot:5416882-Pyramimonas_sp.AAC.1